MIVLHWRPDPNTARAACSQPVGAMVHCTALEYLGRRHENPDKTCAWCLVEAERAVNRSTHPSDWDENYCEET